VGLPYVRLVGFVLVVAITIGGLALLRSRYGGVSTLRTERAAA
jgi:hypothetical protein